jgi:hypothetical protein
MTSLANAFEPSMRAADCAGPKQAIPLPRTRSARPATSGPSGPTTTSHGGDVVDVDRNRLRDPGDAGIARRTGERGDRRIGGKSGGQGVFTPAGPDE